MGNDIIYIAVFTAQERHYDECERGWLPVFHTVLCAGYDREDVMKVVYDTVYDERHELLDTVWCRTDDGLQDPSFTFRYTDPTFGAYADYTLEVHSEHLLKTDRP